MTIYSDDLLNAIAALRQRIAALESNMLEMQVERDTLCARAEKAEELLRGAIAGEEVSWDDLARIARFWIAERKP